MTVSKVGKKYTIVIPQEVREKVPIKEGEHVVWNVKKGEITIRPVSFRRIAGMVKSSSLTGDEEVAEALEREIKEDIEEA
jgi:AbrB family looped-hinge helix DNA binding protein